MRLTVVLLLLKLLQLRVVLGSFVNEGLAVPGFVPGLAIVGLHQVLLLLQLMSMRVQQLLVMVLLLLNLLRVDVDDHWMVLVRQHHRVLQRLTREGGHRR